VTDFRYDTEALRADYRRAGAGLVLTGVPLAVIHDEPIAVLVVGALFALFAVYGLRTWARGKSSVALDETGITVDGPRQRRRLAWTDLSRLRLKFYSTRRDRSGGWMQLRLEGAGGPIALESTLDGFEEVVERAYRAARDNDLRFDRATRYNLLALGLAVEDEESEPPG